MNKEKLMMGALAGVAVGAAIGMLFAPEKGSEMRRKLKKNGHADLKDLEDKFSAFTDSMNDQLTYMREQAMRNAQRAAATKEQQV